MRQDVMIRCGLLTCIEHNMYILYMEPLVFPCFCSLGLFIPIPLAMVVLIWGWPLCGGEYLQFGQPQENFFLFTKFYTLTVRQSQAGTLVTRKLLRPALLTAVTYIVYISPYTFCHRHFSGIPQSHPCFLSVKDGYLWCIWPHGVTRITSLESVVFSFFLPSWDGLYVDLPPSTGPVWMFFTICWSRSSERTTKRLSNASEVRSYFINSLYLLYNNSKQIFHTPQSKYHIT